jgi:hypothetical protein
MYISETQIQLRISETSGRIEKVRVQAQKKATHTCNIVLTSLIQLLHHPAKRVR